MKDTFLFLLMTFYFVYLLNINNTSISEVMTLQRSKIIDGATKLPPPSKTS